MDESDERLAETLRQELMGSGRKTAFGPDDAGDEGGAFFDALEAFRAAKRTGDKDEVAAAERALQQVVRNEMTREESCKL